jgi:hypothetical protein
MRVFSTFVVWTNENKSCMRVEKRQFTWEFSQLLLLDQTRTIVALELRSKSLHESFLNFYCLNKREQELHEGWEARVYMRVFQHSLLSQTRTRVAWGLRSESLHESFLNIHCFLKREQELHEGWEARVYMSVFSTFVVWTNENKSCMRVEKREFTWEFSQLLLLDQTRTIVALELRSKSLHESFLNFRCLNKREQELHESWEARVYMRVFSTSIAWSNENKLELHESREARVYMRVFSTFVVWTNENKSCMRVEKREFTWEFSQLLLLDQLLLSVNKGDMHMNAM